MKYIKLFENKEKDFFICVYASSNYNSSFTEGKIYYQDGFNRDSDSVKIRNDNGNLVVIYRRTTAWNDWWQKILDEYYSFFPSAEFYIKSSGDNCSAFFVKNVPYEEIQLKLSAKKYNL